MTKERFPSPEAAGFIVSVGVVAIGFSWILATPLIAGIATALIMAVIAATISVLRSRGDF